MATIKDVARLAGVGVGTASRVISGKGSFSQSAAERVEAAARQLGFRPSAIARALSLQSTGTIGVFVPDFKGPFYGPLLDAIDAELRLHDRHMVAANGCGNEDTRQQSLDGARFLIERECDGIILCSTALRDADFAALRESFANLAIVNRDVKGMKSHCFTVDHRAAGRAAADALLAHGHRRIAVISGPAGVGDNKQRLQGLFDRLGEAGVAPDSVLVEEGDFSAPSGWAACERVVARVAVGNAPQSGVAVGNALQSGVAAGNALQSGVAAGNAPQSGVAAGNALQSGVAVGNAPQSGKPKITALFCANDQMAMGAISYLGHHGIRVPQQWSVMGYDDSDVAAFLSPRLTSVRIPIAEMALNACRQLLNTRFGSALPVSHKFVPTVVMRDTLAKAP